MIANATRTAREITRTIRAEVDRERGRLGSVPLACLTLAQRYGCEAYKVEDLYRSEVHQAKREAYAERVAA